LLNGHPGILPFFQPNNSATFSSDAQHPACAPQATVEVMQNGSNDTGRDNAKLWIFGVSDDPQRDEFC
jgi:hypothetical protein